MTESSRFEPVPPVLRAAIARDLSPVRSLRAPLVRSLALIPMGLVLLIAAPAFFDFRDLRALGWVWAWGASVLQVLLGIALVAAALREAVPGRTWPATALAGWLVIPIAMMIVVTFASWGASPVLLPRYWWSIGGLCFTGSFISALPAVVLAMILALGAYPTRPAVAGGLAGLGAGLMADAGWRLFCHFSEPAHVLTAHLGGVVVAAVFGALLTTLFSNRLRR